MSSSDSCTLQQISGSDWGNGNFLLKLRTARDGGGSVLIADTVVNYGQTAHWEIVASKTTSDVPKPVSFNIKSISTKMGTDSSFTPLTISAGLVLNNADGGDNGVEHNGISTAYSLYWSNLWNISFFPTSTTRTNVTLRVTFDLAYPSVPTTAPARISRSTETTTNGRKNFFEHRIISRSTASFGLVSPRFVIEGQSSAANVGLIIGLSVMGGVIVIGAAVAVFFLVKYKTQAVPVPAADMEAQSSSFPTTSIKDFE